MRTFHYRNTKAFAFRLAVACWLATETTFATSIWPGFDLIQTPSGGAQFDFGIAPSPLDNLGVVPFGGLPTGPGGTDTIIQRFDILPVGGTGAISAEIIELSLVSPTIVNLAAFGNSDPYEILIGLTPGLTSPGTVTLTTHDDGLSPPGGTFDSSFTVRATATFRNLANPGLTFTAPLPDDTLSSSGASWQHIPPADYPETPSLPAGKFYIGPIVHDGPHPITFPAILEGVPGTDHLPPLCDPGEFQEGYHIHQEKHAEWEIDEAQMVIDLTPPSRHCPTVLISEVIDDFDLIENFETQLIGNFDITTAEGTFSLPAVLSGPAQTAVRGRVNDRQVSPTGSWDTEILSMSLSGNVQPPGGAPLDVRVRIDPNRQNQLPRSLGHTIISENPPSPVVVKPGEPTATVIPALNIPYCSDLPSFVGGVGQLQDHCHEVLSVVSSAPDPNQPNDLLETLNTRFTGDLATEFGLGHLNLTGQTDIRAGGAATRQTGTFDTEILSMDLTGHVILPDGQSLPAILRESRTPEQQSRGETSVTDLGNGNFRIDSFFDVWTEVSIDGGQFIPVEEPIHVVQRNDPTAVIVADPGIPAIGIPYCSDLPTQIGLGGPTIDEHCHEVNFVIETIDQGNGVVLERLDTNMTGLLNNGSELVPLTLKGETQVLSAGGQRGEPGTFDTEIISMFMTDPEGTVVVKESAEHRSTGQTQVTQLGDGNFRIDSFFDVFFDITITDVPGASSTESVGPVRVTQSRVDNEFIIDSFFDVWTEISVNGGPWHPQESVARMGLGPKPRAGDLNSDGFTENSELLKIFANFTGPVNSNNPTQDTIVDRRRSDGDTNGTRDVAVDDVLASFADFTGPPAQAGPLDGQGFGGENTPNVADLVYDRDTGNVRLESDDSSILGFVLKNAAGGDDFAIGTLFPADGVSTDITTEVSWANLQGIQGMHDLGDIFPAGLVLTELETFLTTADYSPGLGMAVTPFDLRVVPEPGNLALLSLGILGLYGYCRRKHA